MTPVVIEPAARPSRGRRSSPVPHLQNGDRLEFDEFERRWEAMPWLKKAELINGRVYMQGTVSAEFHGGPDNQIQGWLCVYAAHTDGVNAYTNSTARCDDKNAPQPDGALCIASACGGQSRTNEKGVLIGVPELVAEIAASSASYDLHDKLEVYERFGVQEYFVWLAYEEEIRCYRLREGKFQPLTADAQGVVRSEVFPGLWLDVAAMMRDDMRRALAALNEGIASKEHAEFVERLKSTRSKREAAGS